MSNEYILNRLFQRIHRTDEYRRSGSRSPPDPERSHVKRALFGPVDNEAHEANKKFVVEELAKESERCINKYNFDFINEQPKNDGRWEWERCFPQGQSLPKLPSLQNMSEVKEDQKENSLVESTKAVSGCSTLVVPLPPTVDPVVSAPLASLSSTPSSSSSLPSSSCDNISSSVSASKSSNSFSNPHSQRQSAATRSKITGHFPQRKRSKSKVKTQERKPECERDISPPCLPATTTTTTNPL